MAIRLILFFLVAFAFNALAQQGEPYELAEIQFSGNDKISSAELEAVIYSEETPWWFSKFLNSFTPFGKEPVYFESSNISTDIIALEKYYYDNGFFKVRIDTALEIDSSAKEVILSYNITENEHSHYGNIRYKGLETIPDNIRQRIFAETMVNPELFFSKEMVENNNNHVLDILLNRGYMLVSYDSTVIYRDTIANTAGLDLYFTPGTRFKISEVQVVKKGEGAPYVDDDMLRDLTGIEKDEYYNNQKIKTSQARIVRTGLFHSINLVPARRDTSGDYVPLKLEGSIGLLNEFLPGVSINDEFDLFNVGLNANYTRKNFLGNARKFSLTSEVSVIDILHFNFADFFFEQNYLIDGYALINLKIEQPYLFQKPITGILENYFQTSTLNKVNAKTYGIKTTFDFEMPYYTFINQLSPYFNLEFYDEKIEDYVRQDTIYFSKANIFTRTSFLGVQLGSAKTDNLYFPTSGNNQLLSVETAISFGEADINAYLVEDTTHSDPIDYMGKSTTLFYRLEFTSTYYFPLSKSKTSVFATKFKTGYVQAFSGNEDLIPGNRTFFAGGSNSLRGWEARYFPLSANIEFNKDNLLEYILNSDTTTNQKVRGGTFLFEGSFEIRQRFLENLGVAVFVDYGNVWNGYKMFRFDEIALATGFGIRYYSAIAPFRLDFGFKLYDPGKKFFIWDNWNQHFLKNLSFQFGIGEAF
jgi:outer membrane protein insertion porin family